MYKLIKDTAKKVLRKESKPLSPVAGYNIWASEYENDNNLIQYLDDKLLRKAVAIISLNAQQVLDFGCGTGRHWSTLMENTPQQLIGCDISQAMLDQLTNKYPQSETYLLKDSSLEFLKDDSIDVIVSTLTIGHVPDLRPVVSEWSRVTTNDAHLIFTGNHPIALEQGVKRSFVSKGKTYEVANTTHTFEKIRHLLKLDNWNEEHLTELVIDHEHRSWFEKKGAIASFEKILGSPVIYMMIWKK